MGRHTLEGNPPINVIFKRTPRARRLSLRVSRLDGRVTLTLPQWTPEREGLSFLQSKESWLRKQIATLSPPLTVQIGSKVPFRGVPLVVTGHDRGRAIMTPKSIEVGIGKPAGAQVKALLRHHARDRLAMASDHYAAVIGKDYTRLTLRDTRSRWGSCSSDRALMYSWRLIMAPDPILNYVAAHEVAHLAEMNHSQAFWDVVAKLCPDFQEHRAWLRAHGEQLHRYAFTD